MNIIDHVHINNNTYDIYTLSASSATYCQSYVGCLKMPPRTTSIVTVTDNANKYTARFDLRRCLYNV